MDLINKILLESESTIKTSSNSKLFFHGGNLQKFDYNEILTPKGGRYEYGIGLYLTTSRNVVEKYSKGSRKLYVVEIDKNIVSLDNVKVNVSEILNALKNILSKNDLITFKSRVDKMGKEEISLESVNVILMNNDILKPKYASDIVKLFISKGADASVDSNVFGWGEEQVVLFNFKKIKSIKQINKNDNNYFNDL